MAQWINILRNNSFVNPIRLPLLCEKTGVPSHSGTGVAGMCVSLGIVCPAHVSLGMHVSPHIYH